MIYKSLIYNKGMKLLVCLECQDIFNLREDKKKTCSCGKSSGKYRQDGLHADYEGPCLPLGFTNGSFIHALHNQPETGMGKEFTAFVIQKKCDTFLRHGDEPNIPKPVSHVDLMRQLIEESLSKSEDSKEKKPTKKKNKKKQ